MAGAAVSAAVSSMALQIHVLRPICCDKSPVTRSSPSVSLCVCVVFFFLVERSRGIKGCLCYGSDADIVSARRGDLREIPTLSMGMVLEVVVVVAYK